MLRIKGLLIGVVVGALATLSFTMLHGARAEERWYKVPGDVNGDGEMNIADAIYILNYIFALGPAPVACEPCPVPRLPATGQEHCWTAEGIEAPCANTGQDGELRQGLARDFQVFRLGPDPGTWITADYTTGLMWQYADDEVRRDWPQAIDYCEGLTLAGLDDWRLPNVRELQSIVDYGREGNWNPSINTDAFLGRQDAWADERTSWFWTSTTDNAAKDQALICDFHWGGGVRSNNKKNGLGFVRSVRTIQPGDTVRPLGR